MTCNKAAEIDVGAFLTDAAHESREASQEDRAAFRAHFVRCPDCASAVVGWTRLEEGLRSHAAATAHPEPEMLARFASEPGALEPHMRGRITEHVAGCVRCRTEASALRSFDFAALGGAPAVGETAPRTTWQRRVARASPLRLAVAASALAFALYGGSLVPLLLASDTGQTADADAIARYGEVGRGADVLPREADEAPDPRVAEEAPGSLPSLAGPVDPPVEEPAPDPEEAMPQAFPMPIAPARTLVSRLESVDLVPDIPEGERFRLDEGLVHDAKLGLRWYVPRSREVYTYEQAVSAVAELRAAGRTWQLPTRAQIESLGGDVARFDAWIQSLDHRIRSEADGRYWLRGTERGGRAQAARFSEGRGRAEIGSVAISERLPLLGVEVAED